MEFKASLSNKSKFTTVLILVICVVALIPSFVLLDGQYLFKIIIALIIIASLAISSGFRTTGYRIMGTQLGIKRPFGEKVFDLRDIRVAEKIPAKDLRFSLRTFGNGGFFGFYGKFWNRKFGSMTWFATNLENAILLTMNNGRKIIVTPDETEKFIDVIKKPTQRI